MFRQSRPSCPALLLTRPAAQNARFAAEVTTRFGPGLHVVDSPLLAPRFLETALPAGPFEAVAFTSETGVEGFRRLTADAGLPSWCIGPRTVEAARAAGFVAREGGGEAKAMAARIVAARPRLPVLVVRGRDQAVDLVALLRAGGLRAQEVVVYAQELQPLGPAAQALLALDGPVVAPLFSARTAAHFAAEPVVRSRRCPLFIAALSQTIAEAAGQARAERMAVAPRPDVEGLIAALHEWYGTQPQP